MDKYLETPNLLRLNHEEIEYLNRLMTRKEIESEIKNLSANQSPGQDSFPGEFYQTFSKTYSSQSLPKN